MNRNLRAALAHFGEARARGASLVLLFDYDGTLVPIAGHPRMAVMLESTRRRLARLARMPAMFVGMVSGRTIDDLRDRVGLVHAYYAGTGGLEIACGHTAMLQPDPTRVAPLLADVAASVRHVLNGYAGAWLEQKPLGLTAHYREVAPRRTAAIRRAIADAVQPWSGSIRVVDGAMAVEITPDLGWTKGTALRIIAKHAAGAAALPLYAGDEMNDADAMLAAAELGGLTLGIGAQAPSIAQYRLPDSASLEHCLDELLEIVGEGAPMPVSAGTLR
jgi:trehalose 6-phosphate synthase/phosphatase